MEPLYTAETRNQIERVMRVFQDYIIESRHFDILYSEKIGYIYMDIDTKRRKIAESIAFSSKMESNWPDSLPMRSQLTPWKK